MAGCFMENLWKFNIKYENEFKNYYSNKNVLLDILVNNNTEATAICDISNGNEYCFYMIPLREYNNIDNNYVHAYSNLISDIGFLF